MLISEIFYSIQGEAQATGLPCCFIRLSGCPFRCEYCDTTYARSEPGSEQSIGEILVRLRSFPCRLVEVTGGEPLAQRDTPALLQGLLDAGYSVLLETSGHLPLERVPAPVKIVMDIKTPGSGRPGFHPANVERLGGEDAVKFVLCDRSDFDWAVRKIIELDLPHWVPVYMSPAWGRLEPSELAGWIMAAGLPVRLQLPLHKLLWGDQRGR